jgi:uncharacterized membrane protein YwzB
MKNFLILLLSIAIGLAIGYFLLTFLENGAESIW